MSGARGRSPLSSLPCRLPVWNSLHRVEPLGIVRHPLRAKSNGLPLYCRTHTVSYRPCPVAREESPSDKHRSEKRRIPEHNKTERYQDRDHEPTQNEAEKGRESKRFAAEAVPRRSVRAAPTFPVDPVPQSRMR